MRKQAGAELCQAQAQVGLPAKTRFHEIPDVLCKKDELILNIFCWWLFGSSSIEVSSIEVVFPEGCFLHLKIFKIILSQIN